MVSDDVRRQLRGHTIVLKCLFETQFDDGDCTLTLDLADEWTPGSSVVRVRFSSVSNLSIREFGGGITQVMCLVIEDVREWQCENVVYRVSESEHDTISFLCRDVSILTRYPVGQTTS
jgi:hypothetical protein